MGMQYIRNTYGVPAKRGGRVRYAPPNRESREGRIIGADGPYLRIKLDPRPGIVQHTTTHHPTWCIEYI